MCTFKNTDLNEIDLDTIQHVYRKDFGCHSPIYIRFKERFEIVSKIYNDFVSLKTFIDSNNYISYFDEQINKMIQKHYVFGKENNNLLKENEEEEKEEKEEEEKEEKEIKEEVKKDMLDILIKKIYSLKDPYMQENYVYNLIDKDGILIGKDVYSKKFKRMMPKEYICGHFIYKNRMRKTNDPVKRNDLIQDMMDEYGDQGEASGDVQTCTHCGRYLGNFKFDDVEGYTENGQMIRSRDVWEKDEEEMAPQTVEEVEELYNPMAKTLSCESPEFRKIFLEKGLPEDDIQYLKNICIFLQKNLCDKVGIQLNEYDTIDIITDSLRKIRSLLSLLDFTRKEAQTLISTKRISTIRIQQMIKDGDFERNYELYKDVQFSSVIAARFLIAIQTAIPEYKYSTKNSPCPFSSFYGLDGIQFVSCLLREMKNIGGSKNEQMEKYMNTIGENYDDFKKMTGISQKFIKKRDYKTEMDKRFSDFNTSLISNISIVYDEVPPLNDNFIELVKKSNHTDFQKYYLQWIHRIHYLNQELRKIYMTTYNSDVQYRDVNPESSVGVSIVEKACCDSYLDNYADFIQFIQEKNPDSLFTSMIVEIKSLYSLSYLFQRYGNYHRTITKGEVTDSYFVHNEPSYVSPKNNEFDFIMDTFLTYVDNGPYVGTMRSYVGIGKDKKDTKTGKTYDEIASKKYTKQEYLELLNKISEKRKSSLSLYEYNIFEKEKMIDMKKSAYDEKDKEINKLIQTLKNILNKTNDKDFIEKYTSILSNIGYYQYYMQLKDDEKKNATKKDIVKNTEKLEHIRIMYLKKCYNDYLRKYLSMIKNNVSRVKEIQKLEDSQLLPFTENDISVLLQKFITENSMPFEVFLDPNVQLYFYKAKLKHSAEYISNIHAEDNLYNCTHSDVLKFADFNFKDCGTILHYMFVKELNDLILCNQESEDEDLIDENSEEDDLTMNANMMSTQCKYRCLFIVEILNLINEDMEYLDKCSLEIEKMKNAKNYSYLNELERALSSNDNSGHLQKQLQYSIFGRITMATALPQEGEGEELTEHQMKMMDTVEEFENKLRAEYRENNDGKDIPEGELNELREKYLEDMYSEKMLDAENDNLEEGNEGDYGGLGGNDFEEDGYGADELQFIATQE